MPHNAIVILAGNIIGIIASLAGIGGGSLIVPFLNKYGVRMAKSIGSSAFCSCIVALGGILGFILQGYSIASDLPQYSLGYIYLPALFAISISAMLTTKLGVKLTVILPTAILKKIFAIFLICIALKMLFF